MSVSCTSFGQTVCKVISTQDAIISIGDMGFHGWVSKLGGRQEYGVFTQKLDGSVFFEVLKPEDITSNGSHNVDVNEQTLASMALRLR